MVVVALNYHTKSQMSLIQTALIPLNLVYLRLRTTEVMSRLVDWIPRTNKCSPNNEMTVSGGEEGASILGFPRLTSI